MPVKKSPRQVKKATLHPKPISRAEVSDKQGIGMEFDFNPNLTITLKIVERMEALVVHLFVTALAFVIGIYFAIMGRSFTTVAYRK